MSDSFLPLIMCYEWAQRTNRPLVKHHNFSTPSFVYQSYRPLPPLFVGKFWTLLLQWIVERPNNSPSDTDVLQNKVHTFCPHKCVDQILDIFFRFPHSESGLQPQLCYILFPLNFLSPQKFSGILPFFTRVYLVPLTSLKSRNLQAAKIYFDVNYTIYGTIIKWSIAKPDKLSNNLL